MEYLDIIDIETDRVIWKSSHDDIYKKKLSHRIVHIIIYRSNGNIILQKRSPKKYFYPNAWATGACGHVSSGESYETAAIRETQEEIGITPNISLVKKIAYDSENWIKKMLWIYKAFYDGDFRVNEEVSKIQEFTLEEILDLPNETLHP